MSHFLISHMMEPFYLEDSVVACHFESSQFIDVCFFRVHVSDMYNSTLNTLVLRIWSLVFRPIALLFQILWSPPSALFAWSCWSSDCCLWQDCLGRWTAWHPLHLCHLLSLVLVGDFCCSISVLVLPTLIFSPVLSASFFTTYTLFGAFLRTCQLGICHWQTVGYSLFVCSIGFLASCLISALVPSPGMWWKSQAIRDLLGRLPSQV